MKKLFLILTLLCAQAFAAVPVVLSPVPKQQFWNSNGTSPLSFGCIFSYISGSTTPLATYTDSTGTVVNTNPLILSAGGFAGSGSSSLWLQAGQAYRLSVKSAGGTNCASGTTQYTIDGVGGGLTLQTTVVTYSATPAFPIVAQNQLFEITLTGNAVAQPMTAVGIIPPAWVAFRITQDGAGGHSFTWPANSVGGATIDPAASSVSSQLFYWDGSTLYAIGVGHWGNGPEISTGTIHDFGDLIVSGVITGNITVTGGVTASFFAHGCTPIAISGTVRLCQPDVINWRNNANNADQGIGVDTQDHGLWGFANGLRLSGANPDIYMGGITSSFPKIKSNVGTPSVNFRNGTDAADIPISASVGTFSTSVVVDGVTETGTPAASGYCLTSTGTTAANWQQCLPFSGWTESNGTSGYIKFPAALGGLTMEWVRGASNPAGEGTYTTNFPTAFATACDNVQIAYEGQGVAADDAWYQFVSCSTTSVTYYKQTTGGTTDTSFPRIFAVGH